jgi:4-hydroxyphenylpyruvate dioxygenase
MESLGIMGFDSYHFAVENLERSKSFYREKLDFDEVARGGDLLVQRSGQASVVFGAGEVRVCVSTPLHEDCRAARYLRRHPAGIMSLSFRVEDLDRTLHLLEKRGAAILADPIEDRDASGGRYRSFEIATPLGDVVFRYIERTDYPEFGPGFEQLVVRPRPNRFGIERIDHVTANALTMQPLILFYREVLGMEEFWRINFHTADFPRDEGKEAAAQRPRAAHHGTGPSIVMGSPWRRQIAPTSPSAPSSVKARSARFCYDNNGQDSAPRHALAGSSPYASSPARLAFLPTHKATTATCRND